MLYCVLWDYAPQILRLRDYRCRGLSLNTFDHLRYGFRVGGAQHRCLVRRKLADDFPVALFRIVSTLHLQY